MDGYEQDHYYNFVALCYWLANLDSDVVTTKSQSLSGSHSRANLLDRGRGDPSLNPAWGRFFL